MKFFFHYFLMMVLLSLACADVIAQSDTSWNREQAAAWFKKHEWIPVQKPAGASVKYDQFGRSIENASPDSNAATVNRMNAQHLNPHASIDKMEFAKQYHAHKSWWDEAFAYLNETDLTGLKPGRYPIDGDNVYATVTEAPLKDLDKSMWEAHRNYNDIHLMINGKEKIGIAPFSAASVVTAYDPAKDIGFYTAEGRYYTGDPETYFIVFPKDAHRPGLKIKDNDVVKKIVIKVRTGNQ